MSTQNPSSADQVPDTACPQDQGKQSPREAGFTLEPITASVFVEREEWFPPSEDAVEDAGLAYSRPRSQL